MSETFTLRILYGKNRRYTLTIPPEKLYGLRWTDGIHNEGFDVKIVLGTENNTITITKEGVEPIGALNYTKRLKAYRLLDKRKKKTLPHMLTENFSRELIISSFKKLVRGEHVKLNLREETKKAIEQTFTRMKLFSKKANRTKEEDAELYALKRYYDALKSKPTSNRIKLILERERRKRDRINKIRERYK